MLRKRVNEHIAHIWEAKTRREKAELRKQALASKNAFQTLLDSIHAVPPAPYDVSKDRDGIVTWAPTAAEYATRFPLTLALKAPLASADEVHSVVRQIVDQFQFLVETKGLNKVLYADDGDPRHESIAQRLFFGIAYSYCQANDVDLSVEHNTGTGAVDFKFSRGFRARVLVEVKLSTNPKTVAGYSKQIETYKNAERTKRAIYLVINVGEMGTKIDRLFKLRNEARKRGETPSDLVIVDGIVKLPPSKQ